MRRKSLKGQLSLRMQQCSDSPQLTDTELLLAAVSSLIHSTEQLHGKLRGRCVWTQEQDYPVYYPGCQQNKEYHLTPGHDLFPHCQWCGALIEIGSVADGGAKHE